MARTPSFRLDELTPEKLGNARAQPTKEGDPIRSQTIRLPASVWQKRRLLAAAKGTTSIGELRAPRPLDPAAREDSTRKRVA